jgi:predicted acylesterase/phospholipase RssA
MLRAVDVRIFLDEFRPFRRGEIALARRLADEPGFLPARELALLRHTLRLAQLSSLGGEADELVDRVGSLRLKLLQLLAPVLPTEPAQIDAARLVARLPKVVRLVGETRRRLFEAGLTSEIALDAELANKRLALVLGGAAGSGYIFLGALAALEGLGIRPAYLIGCSVGSLLGVIRARTAEFALPELFEDVRRIRERGLFRLQGAASRYGLPAALRLDLRGALGDLFERDGRALRLDELAIPMDALATGLGPGALTEPRESYARMVDFEVRSAAALEKVPAAALARLVGPLVSLAMSRQVLVPVLLGGDPETRRLSALDAAGFSAAIPGVLSYDVASGDVESARVLDALFERHKLAGLVDGALASLVPARYAWEAIEAGRIGSRHCAVLALDAVAKARGANAPLIPLLRVAAATADRDKAFWDLHVNFKKAPPFLALFPSDESLRRSAAQGELEFAETARVLPLLLAPVPPWKDLSPDAIAHTDDRFV